MLKRHVVICEASPSDLIAYRLRDSGAGVTNGIRAKPTGIVRAKCYAAQSATSRGREPPLEAVGATSRISHGWYGLG